LSNRLLHQDVLCSEYLLNVLLALHVLATIFISVDVIYLCETIDRIIASSYNGI